MAGLAVSLAVQSSLSNLAGGLMVMTNKPFSADDYIEVSGMGGTVREVTLFYTKLLTDDGKEIFVPNSEIAGAQDCQLHPLAPAAGGHRLQRRLRVAFERGAGSACCPWRGRWTGCWTIRRRRW